ncbi:hypothetical protein CR513_32967, partial [Mucuna pruriens]
MGLLKGELHHYRYVVNDEQNQVEDFIPPRRLERVSKPIRSTKFRDYFIYLQEHEISPSGDFGPNSFQEAISKLHQMDVKITFLNSDLCKDVYMNQLDGFKEKGKKHLVCKLRKSIYGLKQASRQWYLRFDKSICSLDFKENAVEQCIYLENSGRKFIILVLYVDDILLACNDMNFLLETKQMIAPFYVKDLGDASFILGIKIHCDRLYDKNYIEKVLNRFNMKFYNPNAAPIQKGEIISNA